MRRAFETAAEVLIRQKWSTLADVHVEHTPWRGLAACWARNAAWLRAPQVVAPDRAHVWRDALGSPPTASWCVQAWSAGHDCELDVDLI